MLSNQIPSQEPLVIDLVLSSPGYLGCSPIISNSCFNLTACLICNLAFPVILGRRLDTS